MRTLVDERTSTNSVFVRLGSLKSMAPVGQAAAQRPQPTQAELDAEFAIPAHVQEKQKAPSK